MNFNELAAAQKSMVVKVYGKVVQPCDTLQEASLKVRSFIDQNWMGASKWCSKTNGNVYDNNGKVIARISYNGRIWDTEGNKIG